ncbi:MAG: putative outer membrane protein, involved in nutrient binding [Bacteroidetes bacterium]|nr:putative outer membrane protein, involved in nutrient binding [Bacteroidota bacterium]
MKYIKYFTLGLISLLSILSTGCSSDFLETTSTDAVSTGTVTSSVNSLYIALNGIHRKMVSQDLSIQAMGGEPGFMISRDAHGDDMTWKTNTWLKTHLNWAINEDGTSSYNSGVWKTYYQFILNANLILESLETVDKSSASDATLANYIEGECLCIRAWAHFQLVQYYAKAYEVGATNTQLGVPYRESSATVNMARNTVEEVYAKINADLDAATTLLSGYSAAVNHYTEKTAWGLRARVALVQHDYANAGDYAAMAIELAETEGYVMMTADQTTNGFADITTTTKDALYAAMTQDDQTVYFYSFYAYMSWNFNSTAIRQGVKCLNQATYDMMSATDVRRAWWDPAGTASVPTTSYAKAVYQNRKFAARSTSDAVGDVAFMRLSELYLIAAEAYARAGDDTNAKKYFLAFVAQRDPSYVDKGNTGDALAEEIMIHRRIELWGEGFRWFDLKRLNLPCTRDGSNFDISFCGFLTKTQSETGWYYEIPKAETDANDLMEKNY